MKILVLGSGAREHAILRALASERAGHELLVAPGNIGMLREATLVRLDPNSPTAVADYATVNNVDLVIIGPEAPLVAGVADALRTRGLPVFGPGAQAAALEGSKSFAKRIMEAAGVPTARASRASDVDTAIELLDRFGAPYVVKADGLAAGKGVLVTEDREAAIEHAKYWLASGPVLIEEFLDGDEVSLFLLSDGDTVRPLIPAQDFKRVGEGDTGPNTGGMGSYAPLPWLAERFGGSDKFVAEVVERVGLPVVRQLDAEGIPFIGLLYCGLIVTADGIRVIEFNARFGDPETQAILPLLKTPLSRLLLATATGSLERLGNPEFGDEVAVSVVLASEGYPEAPVTGLPLGGLDEAEAVPGVHIDYAGVALDPAGAGTPAAAASLAAASATASAGSSAAGSAPASGASVGSVLAGPAPARSASSGSVVSAGGRVLNVVAVAADFATARARAYEALAKITLRGSHFRPDIASRASSK